MIGLLLAQPGEDGAPLFTHESLASRLLEEEGADQVGTKALGELLRRTQRCEMERSRPLPYLYKIFAEEMTDEVISPWYGAASDALERSFLLQDMAGVDHLAGIIRTLPKSGRHVADDAYHWMLQGRVKQLLGQELGTAGQFFARAQIGFNKAISKVGATPYLRYMRLLAMEARLNVEYKLTKNSGATYVALVNELLDLSLQTDIRWALESIAPASRRAYFLAEALAPVSTKAAAGALRQAILVDPRLAHFDLRPFPDEEPINVSRYLGQVAEYLETSDAPMLQASRELVPRGHVTAANRVKYSNDIRKIYQHTAASADDDQKEASMLKSGSKLFAIIVTGLLVIGQALPVAKQANAEEHVLLARSGPPVTFDSSRV